MMFGVSGLGGALVSRRVYGRLGKRVGLGSLGGQCWDQQKS